MSYVDLLTVHRELLVDRLRSIQCLLDNLSSCGFFCEEDVDIVQQNVTRTEKVGGGKHLGFGSRSFNVVLKCAFCTSATRGRYTSHPGTFK